MPDFNVEWANIPEVINNKPIKKKLVARPVEEVEEDPKFPSTNTLVAKYNNSSVDEPLTSLDVEILARWLKESTSTNFSSARSNAYYMLLMRLRPENWETLFERLYVLCGNQEMYMRHYFNIIMFPRNVL